MLSSKIWCFKRTALTPLPTKLNRTESPCPFLSTGTYRCPMSPTYQSSSSVFFVLKHFTGAFPPHVHNHDNDSKTSVQATMRGMLNIVEDISQARAEALSLKLQAGMDRKIEAQNKEEDNVEGLESRMTQGGAGAEEANAELKTNAGTKADEEHENIDDDVLQFDGGEGDTDGPDKFDAAAVARAAEAEAQSAEAEAKAAAAEAMMAREDARAEAEEKAKAMTARKDARAEAEEEAKAMTAREDARAAETEVPTSSEC